MRAEIVFEIYFGIAKWHAVLLEQRVYLEASLELKEPADLSLRQGADAIPLNGDRLKRPSRDVVPSPSERRRHIFGQVDSDLHGELILAQMKCRRWSAKVGSDRVLIATRLLPESKKHQNHSEIFV